MKKLGFYPGCSLKGSSSEYAQSVLAVAKAFDLELTEINDWNCCGATAAHNMNKELALSLSARILALAEKQGMTEVVVPCAACYNRLTVTQHELNKDEALKQRVSDIIEMPISGNLQILNVMQLIDKYVADRLEEKVTTPFGHKVACYYGCLLVRPHNILQFDRLEDPQSMDILMKRSGAEPIAWGFKTECCGAGFSVSRTDVVAKLSGNIVKDAADRGAEAIIVACPMCQSNLDMRRPQINEYLKQKIDIPVLYITQAIGLAVGLSPKEVGLQKHFVPVEFSEQH
ncbi:MAG: CoB--CoM heterodisulfide reductase iron-sulfur subunit B family protein [Bacteroidota bacterium]|nr:CoB--CoM heterodisulfide reductase iron-sulfur subunit B family protein [Bacteroidota bacterium]